MSILLSVTEWVRVLQFDCSWYILAYIFDFLFLSQGRPQGRLCRCARVSLFCPWGNPTLTAAVSEVHCHVGLGSDGQSGRGPDRVQPFPGSPSGNVTSSIKTWAYCLRFILNPSWTSEEASIWSWALVGNENSLQWREDVCRLQYISSSRPQL